MYIQTNRQGRRITEISIVSPHLFSFDLSSFIMVTVMCMDIIGAHTNLFNDEKHIPACLISGEIFTCFLRTS